MSLTEDFISLLFDHDLIANVELKAAGTAMLFPHYPTSSKMWVSVSKPGTVRVAKTTTSHDYEKELSVSEAIEYVRRWSLAADTGQGMVRTSREAARLVRDLLDRLPLEVSSKDLDVEKFADYVTYPRVGNHRVHGLLVRLPESRAQLTSLLEECRNE